jgi:DnaK suppressor protein
MTEDATEPANAQPLGAPDPHQQGEGPAQAVAIAEVAPGGPGEESLSTRSPEEAIDEVDQLLDAVEAALVALDDGTYGRCQACGSAIEPSRLAEDPLARACRSCVSETVLDRD